jgi:NAD+ synthase (glutamine-hydrolysing)
MAKAGVDAVLNISASPYHRGKLAVRERILTRAAHAYGRPPALLQPGGRTGRAGLRRRQPGGGAAGILARAEQFRTTSWFRWKVPTIGKRLRGVPTIGKITPARRSESPPRQVPERLADAALTLGLRDYVDKNGFKGVVLGISGGIDSALVAALAVDALGADRVPASPCPRFFPPSETLGDAHLVARNLGIRILEVPIKAAARAVPGRTGPAVAGPRARHHRGKPAGPHPRQHRDGALQQVRLAGADHRQQERAATGYCTLYGDMAGGFAVIKDVPKTLVFELARWRNQNAGREIIPAASHRPTPPTAELRREPEGPGLAAALRRAGRDHRALRRARRIGWRASSPPASTPPVRPVHPPGGPQRIQAPPGRARGEDHPEGLRARPPPAHHEPVWRTDMKRKSEIRNPKSQIFPTGAP